MTGNSFSTETFTGWYDAFSGLLLKGDGEGNFKTAPFSESGFYFPGDAKALTNLKGSDNEELILAARNNGALQMFEVSQSHEKRALQLQSNEVSAEIRYKNGRVEKREFYDGGGYLSQKSHTLFLNDRIELVTICDESGDCRTVSP
jgi:hypothetical protein